MKSQGFNPFSADYRNIFGNSYIRQFDVYDKQERIGQVRDVRVDEAGHFQYLVVDLVAPTQKQVLVPLSQTEIDPQRRRIYMQGLSKDQVLNLPAYNPVAAAQPPQPLSSPRSLNPSPLPEQPENDTTMGTTIRLHEERLIVDRGKRRKIGEVIVRKEIETRIVEIPVRHEKLIVEQVSPGYQQLAIVDLKPDQADLEAAATDSSVQPSVSGEFTSAEAASRFLDAIAHYPSTGHRTIQIRIMLQDAAEQATYQAWLERYLGQ